MPTREKEQQQQKQGLSEDRIPIQKTEKVLLHLVAVLVSLSTMKAMMKAMLMMMLQLMMMVAKVVRVLELLMLLTMALRRQVCCCLGTSLNSLQRCRSV